MGKTLKLLTVALLCAGGLAFQDVARAHGDLSERIATLSLQLQTNATNPQLWRQRADLERQHGEFAAALNDLEQVAQLKPNWSVASCERARIFSDQKNYAAALTAANDCLRLDPTNADALVLRARSHARLGHSAEAVQDFSTVLRLTAQPPPDFYLERAQCQTALGQLEDAVRGLDEGLIRLGSNPALMFSALQYERQQSAWPAALARLEKARPFFNRESFMTLRGEILLESGQAATAAETFQAALTAVAHYPAPRRQSPAAQDLAARLHLGLSQAQLSLESR